MKKKMYKLTMIASVMVLLSGCRAGEGLTGGKFSESRTELSYERIEESASDEEYPELASFLIDYYQIPEEYLQETRYYYNFTDLNEDGINEIVALTIGETTTTSDGECILILSIEDETFQVIGDFRNAHTPVLISSEMKEGWHNVIYPVYGGMQETGYIKCSYQKDEGYLSGEEDFFEEIDARLGIWILSDNLIDDLDQGNYMTLAPET